MDHLGDRVQNASKLHIILCHGGKLGQRVFHLSPADVLLRVLEGRACLLCCS